MTIVLTFIMIVSFLAGVGMTVVLASAENRKVHWLMWVYVAAMFAVSIGCAMALTDKTL